MPTVRASTIFSLDFLLFLCVCCVCEVSNSEVVVIFDLDELWEYLAFEVGMLFMHSCLGFEFQRT